MRVIKTYTRTSTYFGILNQFVGERLDSILVKLYCFSKYRDS